MVSVILLNGTSSSGKTTIANLLRERLGSNWIIKSIDGFLENLPAIQHAKTKDEIGKVVFAAVPEFHREVSRQVEGLRQRLIVDHVLQEKEWAKDFDATCGSHKVIRIGVKCPLEVIERRERGRGDREIGMAKKQFKKVHQEILYDLEVDTNSLTAEECVEEILRIVNK